MKLFDNFIINSKINDHWVAELIDSSSLEKLQELNVEGKQYGFGIEFGDKLLISFENEVCLFKKNTEDEFEKEISI
jgi:hypothetical protein